MRARTALASAPLLVAPLAACSGASDSTADGVPVVNWYIGNESWLPGWCRAAYGRPSGPGARAGEAGGMAHQALEAARHATCS